MAPTNSLNSSEQGNATAILNICSKLFEAQTQELKA